MTYIEEYYKWINDNPDKVCNKVKTIYKRLVDDLKTPKEVSFLNKSTGEIETHTYIFDERVSLRPIHFIEKYCRQSKGKWNGKPLKLELFQKAFIQALFGFIDKDSNCRKYKKAIFFVARKNGKSVLDSAIANYMLTKDNEGGAEIYSIATKKEQAKIVWEESKKMIRKSPCLAKRIRCLVGGIYYDATDSYFRALASDSNSLDGLNAHLVIADEVHAWKDKNLLDVMYDSMSARTQPILLETSTMGTVRQNVFDIEYDYASQVIDGTIQDETLLPIIYELDKEGEWINEDAWYKANPALGAIKSLKDLREKVERAKANPIELVNLLCKDFNIRQNGLNAWLTFDDLNNERIYTDWKDTYCIAGVDLSSTTDLTCATLLGVKNKEIRIKQMYWIPANMLEKKVKDDRIPYDKWLKAGWLRLSGDSKIDYHDVSNWFLEEVRENDLRPLYVGYDSWNAAFWCDEMKSYGFNMVEVRQGMKTMSSPMKQMKADLIDKKINYNNNPILKWCLSNTIVKMDSNENIQPDKEKSRQRIDGAVSLIDAYCIYVDKQQEYLNYIGEEV
ncbi:MAG: terminase large subunit [Bacilli bacterium]|nr:terminase large subunit [Bacilli bacterium]MBR6690770.1 terminase large subunit [Bacilli bacterium]